MLWVVLSTPCEPPSYGYPFSIHPVLDSNSRSASIIHLCLFSSILVYAVLVSEPAQMDWRVDDTAWSPADFSKYSYDQRRVLIIAKTERDGVSDTSHLRVTLILTSRIIGG